MKKWKSGRINTETDSKENVWWMTWETRASSSSSTCFSSYIGYYDTYCQHIFALNADTHHTCSVEVLMSKSHRGPQPHSKTLCSAMHSVRELTASMRHVLCLCILIWLIMIYVRVCFDAKYIHQGYRFIIFYFIILSRVGGIVSKAFVHNP